MEEDRLGVVDQLRLGLSRTFYSVASALPKLTDWLQSTQLSADGALWLLGQSYGDTASSTLSEQELAQVWLDLQSIIWMSYRKDFTPIVAGDVLLRSDAGWGCTLRSGQMVLSQALQRHWLGRDWRWPVGEGEGASSAGASSSAAHGGLAASAPEPPPELSRLLQLFWDAPSERNPLSIHNLCAYGRPCGVHPGRWLGPWVMCHALAKAAAHAQQPLGVAVAVLAEPGGGAPLLSIWRFEAHFMGGESATGETWLDAERGTPVEEEGRRAGAGQQGLLLLVPLVLGLGKLNPVYVPQLQAVLRFPQSVGIVGGRPSSSLFFVGYQGEAVLYLDPHHLQPAACSDGDWTTFHCTTPRTMPLLSIDPSLALGFYCRDLEEYRDLCERLRDLEARAGGAPLLCVTTHEDVAHRYEDAAQWVPDEMSEGSDEEAAAVAAAACAGVAAGGERGSAEQVGAAAEGAGEDGGGSSISEPPVVVEREVAFGDGGPTSPQQQQQQQQQAGAEAPPPLSPAARQPSGKSGWELL